MAMINKHDIFPKIVLMKIKDWPASQEKSLLAWKDRVRRYKELNGGNHIDNVQKFSLLQVARREAPPLPASRMMLISSPLNLVNLSKAWPNKLILPPLVQPEGTKKIHRQTLRHDVHDSHSDFHGYDDLSILHVSYYDVMCTSQQPPGDSLPSHTCP
jgi:hypothetical protein